MTATPAALLPPTPPAEGARVMAAQTAAYVAMLRGLDSADWSRPTDCTEWDVRAMAAHVAGALEEGARPLVMLRHMRAARRATAMVDGLNAAQVHDRRGLAGPAITDEIERLAPIAIRRRQRMPALVRRMPVPGNDLPHGSTLGYLFDVIYARDVWMHRVDTARATRREFRAAAGDDEVVAQVVRDLARFWEGPPFVLVLEGLAAGRWQIGPGMPAATVCADTVALMRMLSGRPGDLTMDVTGDQTLADRLRAARVAF